MFNLAKYATSLALVLSVWTGSSAANVVTHYDFNGNVVDSSGLGNHATAYGSPTFVSGANGQAIYFDNPVGGTTATQWVSLPNTPAIANLSSASFTYALLLRSTDDDQTNGRLFGNSGSGLTSGVVLDYNAQDVPGAYHSVRGNYEVTSRTDVLGNPGAYVTDGRWHWVAVVVDRTNDRALQYVDGTLISSQALGSSLGPVSMLDLNIGRVSGQPQYAARGTAVDEFLLFDVALNASQIPGIPEPSKHLLWLTGLGALLAIRQFSFSVGKSKNKASDISSVNR